MSTTATDSHARLPGLLVTLEGIEGSGKSTQATHLVRGLESRGHRVLATREPGGTPLGREVRKALLDPANAGMDPRAELLLYCADRAEHVARVILPALLDARVVVCDRFSDATRAYQGYGRGLGLELVDRLNVGHREPDLTLLFDLEAKDGLARARRRNSEQALEGESRFEDEELRFHERVRAGYLELAAASPARFQVLDAAASEESLARDAVDRVLALVRARSRTPPQAGS